MDLRESLDSSVKGYVVKDFARVGADESVFHAATAMKDHGTTEAVVMKGDEAVGIITERDILYKVVAAGLVPQQVKSKDVMTSPVESVDESVRVKDAISKMSSLGGRRLGVTKGGKLVGLITQKAIVSGNVEHRILLPELASPGKLACPYCDTTMKDAAELSKHIDQVHLGLGLLQGDKSKW